MKRLVLLILLLLTLATGANASNWYVRNGGNNASCNGHSNVDYSAGVAPNCAFNDPQYAVDAAVLGDFIYFHAAQTFTRASGPVMQFRNKTTGTGWITITTDGTIPTQFTTDYPNSYFIDSSGNAHYNRFTPAIAAQMPKLKTLSPSPVIDMDNLSNHYNVVGLEFTSAPTFPDVDLRLIAGGNAAPWTDLPHDLIFDRCYLHPIEEDGTFNNIRNRSTESAFEPESWRDFEIKNCVIQGFTGWSPSTTWNTSTNPATPTCDNGGACFRLNANSFLSSVVERGNIHNNLMEANGQIFIGAGGVDNPAHLATCTSWTYTSATGCTNTTDLEPGVLFAVNDTNFWNHHSQPDDRHNMTAFGHASQGGPWANGRILTVNHSTGAITFTNLTAGWDYRRFWFYLFDATGGTYTLTWMGQTTAPIAYNANAATIQAALEALSNVAPGDVTVSYSSDYETNFISWDVPGGAWAYPTPINPMTINGSSLTGANDPAWIGDSFSESAHPLESTASGQLDSPQANANFKWLGYQSNSITLERNIIVQPKAWLDAGIGTVKGFAELKGCDHFTANGNIWSSRATGIVSTVRNQGGAVPWASDSYNTYTNNLIDTTGFFGAWSMSDGTFETDRSTNLVVSNNLFLRPQNAGGISQFATIAGVDGATFTHNDFFYYSEFGRSYGYQPATNVVFRDNIFRPRYYFMACFDWTTNNRQCFPSISGDHNLVINDLGLPNGYLADGSDTGSFAYWMGSSFGWVETAPSSIFTTMSPNIVSGENSYDGAGNFRIKTGSLYKSGGSRQASDGTDVGVNFTNFNAAIGYDPLSGGAGIGPVICRWDTVPNCQ
jgi:hypothetical protein